MAHVRRHPKTNRWQGRYRGADGKEHTKLHNRKGDALHWAEDEERKVRLGTWTAASSAATRSPTTPSW